MYVTKLTRLETIVCVKCLDTNVCIYKIIFALRERSWNTTRAAPLVMFLIATFPPMPQRPAACRYIPAYLAIGREE